MSREEFNWRIVPTIRRVNNTKYRPKVHQRSSTFKLGFIITYIASPIFKIVCLFGLTRFSTIDVKQSEFASVRSAIASEFAVAVGPKFKADCVIPCQVSRLIEVI